jgi:predicted metal-dependent hydrolase
VPLRGEPHPIVQAPAGCDLVRVEDGAIAIAGRPALTERLVSSWLRREAGRDLAGAVARHATALALPPPPITLRDPKTRWGSCSARRSLSLSWRLILAPPTVLDYVAAHEVAHLVEMNHSRRFWAVVARLSPDHRQHEAWLREHGRGLHRYG